MKDKRTHIKIEVQKERSTVVVSCQCNDAPVVQTTMRLKRGQTLAKMLPAIVAEVLQ